MRTEWQGKRFNILDTPGYLDFISEALSALRVSDFALVVVNAQHGVGVGTQRVWNYATELNIPKIIVMNEFDKPNTHFEEILDDIRKSYGAGVFPMNIPDESRALASIRCSTFCAMRSAPTQVIAANTRKFPRPANGKRGSNNFTPR